MNAARFLQLLDTLFESPPGTVSAEDLLKDIEGWDSVTFVGLIGMVDREYGVALSPAAVVACETVNDLIRLVSEGIAVQGKAA